MYNSIGTFPKTFPKRQLPKGIFPSGNFLTVQLPKRQLPKSVLATTLGPRPVLDAALSPLTLPSRRAWPSLQPAAHQKA